jgi:hypothetical protein
MSPIYVPGKVVFDNGQAPAAIAGVAPTLDYRFARDKREIETISLTDKLTFTGGNQGTSVGSDGFVQQATTNVPRFNHSPTTKESLGLLVEEARTNLATYSEQINDASWTKQDATVTANSAVSPDSTTTADLIYPSTTGSIRYVTKQIGISSSITTMSFFVKASGFTRCYLVGGATSLAAWFDLSAGTVGTVTANCSATIQSFANGWFRCSLTQPALTNPYISIGPCDANNSFVATASSTNGIFAWGAQLEAGSFPTTYIPTTSATVPRAGDVASINGTGVITGTYTMVEKPAGCAVVSGSNINLQTGFTTQRVMVFPAALSAGQITSIRSAM